METKLYKQDGKENGTITLPESVFGLPWNSDLVHQVVTSMASSARHSIAHTKTRGEVRGGGKKPWQQKGTGRARHGSSRSPIWVGGGVTHGPRSDKNYDRKVNKKMKTKALFTILSRKYRDGEVIFVDALTIASGKTKDAMSTLGAIAPKNTMYKGMYISIPTREDGVKRSFQNIAGVSLEETRSMNPLSLIAARKVVIVNPEASFKILEGKSETKEGTPKPPKATVAKKVATKKAKAAPKAKTAKTK